LYSEREEEEEHLYHFRLIMCIYGGHLIALSLSHRVNTAKLEMK